jgi:hypothetical protein
VLFRHYNWKPKKIYILSPPPFLVEVPISGIIHYIILYSSTKFLFLPYKFFSSSSGLLVCSFLNFLQVPWIVLQSAKFHLSSSSQVVFNSRIPFKSLWPYFRTWEIFPMLVYFVSWAQAISKFYRPRSLFSNSFQNSSDHISEPLNFFLSLRSSFLSIRFLQIL